MRLIDADALIECRFKNDISFKAFEALIKRQSTIEAVPLEDYRSMEQTVHKLTQAIAEAEPIKHGRWIAYKFGNECWHKCSVCGKADEYINDLGLEAVRNYCPNCGATMDGGEDGTE